MPPSDQGPVRSPCIDICSIDDKKGYCKGCYRTLEEIGAWSFLTDDEKRTIIDALPARKQT